MKRNVGVLLLIVCCLGMGCATAQKEYNDKIGKGDYTAAAKVAQGEANKGGEDELVWRLQAGSAYFYAGDTVCCIRELDLSEDIFARNDKESIFSKTLSGANAILTNDLAFSYNGMGVDRIYCCAYKALDYASIGKVNAARTEFNRAMQHQENWIFERRKDVAASMERLKADSNTAATEKKVEDADRAQKESDLINDAQFQRLIKENTGYDAEHSGDLEKLAAADYTSAYISHLCGIFRWLNGDNGRNYLKDVAALKPEHIIAKQDYQAANSGRFPQNQVWIYVEDGLCPYRDSWRFDLPLALIPYINRYVLWASMALPVFRERSNASDAYFVDAGGTSVPLQHLENVDKLIRTEYDVYLRQAIAREVSRVLIRTGAQVALGIAVDHTGSSGARLSLQLARGSVAAWGAAMAVADTRCWQSLPKDVFMYRVTRPDDGVIVLRSSTMVPLTLKLEPGNSIVWIRRPTAGAAPSIKVIPCKP